MGTKSAPRSAHGIADRATDSSAFENTARVGFAASGVLHLLLAYIVLRIALGGGGNADQSGALATLSVAMWTAHDMKFMKIISKIPK